MRGTVSCTLLLGALASGCGCERDAADCTPWATVDLRVRAWVAGTYGLEVTADGLALSCTLAVHTDGAPPSYRDVLCDQRVERASYVLDTYGTADPLTVGLRAPLSAPTRPETATVVLTHRRPGAPAAALLSTTTPVDWQAPRYRAGRCDQGCGAGAVTVDVPTP